MTKSFALIFCVFLTVTSCTKKQESTISLALNPWPGYEFLYLAEQQGYFSQVGANVKIMTLDSLSDAQRAYISGRVDGLASTMIEAVQSQVLSQRPLKIVLVADYSNGGDVIIANKSIAGVAGLKGKNIGCEVSSLGIFMLYKALNKYGLSLDDVNIVNVEQSLGLGAMKGGKIDAFVSYPPYSLEILEGSVNHTIFTSAEIPFEIIDTLSISEEVLLAKPGLVDKIRTAWQLALDFTRDNPAEAYRIMSEREGISAEEFAAVLGDLKIVDHAGQIQLFKDTEKLQRSAVEVCETLVHVDALKTDCKNLSNMIFE